MAARKIPSIKFGPWFLAAVALCGVIYACFGWTPSSYGLVLDGLQIQGAGPVAGSSRAIRSDEWADETPYFQATVRNRFQRINETSFYREDLRNYYALPLADWSLAFKPQFWAFFALPPATAFSIYYAILMCGFVAGYYLLFAQLEVPAWLAAVAAVILFFAGFTQFWWTTYGPLLASLPWVPLTILQPWRWWQKMLGCAWVFPTFVLSHVYPTLLLDCAWGVLIIILAFRPSVLRSRGNMAAMAAGVVVAAAVVYAYYGDLIPIMRNTVYPGRRISPPGSTPILVALSQFFPYLAFRVDDYQHLSGINICEIGTVGSFLPLLTLCLTRYRALRAPSAARNTLLTLLAGFAGITLWQIAPLPGWIGHLLLWDTGDARRFLFTSGLLLTLASLSLWSNRLISLSPLRITLFVLIGPVASILLKLAWLNHGAQDANTGLFRSPDEFLLCGLLFVAGLAAAWFMPVTARGPVLMVTIALVNVYAFGRFNPLQPARPIFEIPDSSLVRELRREAAASPGGVLVDPRFTGSTLNGLGFRSVNHTLLAPKLDFFRQYFPAMEQARFNQVFNRYAHINLAPIPLPDLAADDVIRVPVDVFVAVRNARRLVIDPPHPGACSQPAAGGISQVSLQDQQLTIEGWAPWPGETDEQGIRVLSARPLRPLSLATIVRPQIAAQLQDYRLLKAGFKLQLASADGRPLRREDLAFFAYGTSLGEVRLACCGCP